MSLLADHEIQMLCRDGISSAGPLISPFTPKLNPGDGYSYGLSSAGYDIRLGTAFKILDQSCQDSKCEEEHWMEVESEVPLVLHPGDLVLAVSHEKFALPRNISGECWGKSTYARKGLIVNVTPLEPGWRGYLTLELLNPTRSPVRVFPGLGIAQIRFQRHQICDVSYADREGKYQDQPRKPTPGIDVGGPYGLGGRL